MIPVGRKVLVDIDAEVKDAVPLGREGPRQVDCGRATILARLPVDTGGKGSFTQCVHGEFIVGSETICPPNIHWVQGEYL